GPSAGSDRGSKRQREGGEHASASTSSETATESEGRSTTGSQSRQLSASESAFAEKPVRWRNPHIRCLKQVPKINQLFKPLSILNGFPSQGDHQHRIVTRKKLCQLLKKRQQFYGFVVNRESTLDVYSKRRIITVIELKIVEWHNYKHLDWISVRRDDDKFYKFKKGDLKRLRLQDIKDMLLLLVQRKLSNLTVEERFAFNVSLRVFTRSIVIQRRVEDLQLGYLPTAILRRRDKERAAAMIQAIDKMLKTRRIMRSLEKFVGG
nr:hypothetical protein [Tanacetum cinerariifolium]